MAQVDVFSLAAAATALLLAAALLCAYAINRRLGTFVWWAGSFALLALWLATMTLRFEAPAVWLKWLSWGSFFAAACLVTHGLYRAGAMRTYPVLRTMVCGALFAAMAITLTLLNARPSHWFVIGPVPTLVFMAWSAIAAFRARAAGYGLALLAGIGAITLISLLHPAGLARAMGPPPPPPSALRGSFGAGSDPAGAINLEPRPAPRGVLDLSPPPGPRPPVEQPLALTLMTIVTLLGLAIALVLRDIITELDRMRRRSSIDAMTGLLNRATFEETAAALLRDTDTRSACLIMFDIDHFKRINDTAGHAAGDIVIARLGQFLREMTGLLCTAGRVGGEEFAVILEGDLGTARQFADDIRSRLSASDFGDDIGWGVTISAGIARRLDGENLLGLTARADKALYAAKKTGRDKVVIAPETEPEGHWQAPAITLAARA